MPTFAARPARGPDRGPTRLPTIPMVTLRWRKSGDPAMGANKGQEEYWASPAGLRWIEHENALDSAMAGLLDLMLDAADISAYDRVIDIGCGTGASTIGAARRATEGNALGVDISKATTRSGDDPCQRRRRCQRHFPAGRWANPSLCRGIIRHTCIEDRYELFCGYCLSAQKPRGWHEARRMDGIRVLGKCWPKPMVFKSRSRLRRRGWGPCRQVTLALQARPPFRILAT